MRKFASVAVLFAGLMALVIAPSLLAYVTFGLQGGEVSGPGGALLAILSLAPAAITLLIGLYLMWRRHELAAGWFDDEPVDLMVDALPLLRIGLIIAGVWLVTESAGSFVGVLVNAAQEAMRARLLSPDELSIGFDNPAISLTSLLIPLAKLGIGFLLVSCSGQIASRLWRDPKTRAVEAAVEPARCPSCGAPYDPHDYEQGATARCAECGEVLDDLRA